MKRLIVIVAVAAGLTGCAAGPSSSADVDNPYNARNMATIERQAAKAGVRVIWINPPQAKSTN